MAARITRATGSTDNVAGSAAAPGDGVSLSYDAATGGYTVRDASGATASFTPAQRSPADSNATVTVYANASGNRTDQLALFNPGADNPRMALTHVSYGAWQRVTDNGTTVDFAQQYFVYGIRQPANQPSTGRASYSTVVDGMWADASGVYALGGTSSFTADFAALTVATTLNLVGQPIAGGGSRSLGRFDGAGTIAALGGGFSGNLTHVGTDAAGNVYSGSFNGAFFGPQGQEVGYSFSLTGPGGVAAGAVVGRGN